MKVGIDTAQNKNTRSGMIHLYSGAGKGKSQAALGLVLRSIGLGIAQPGNRVLMVRFLKGNSRAYAEDLPLQLLQSRYPHLIDTVSCGRSEFFDRVNVTPQDFADARRGWQIALGAIASGLYSVLVLDEICPVLDLGLLPLNEVINALQSKPDNLEIICTGRNPARMLEEIADLHSELNPREPVGTSVGGIEIYDGNGKGKSTNALGRLLKSLGESLTCPSEGGVFLHQFLKGGTGYSEDAAISALKEICPGSVAHSRSGTSSIVWRGQQALIDYTEAERGWSLASEAILSSQYRAVLLDELNPLVDLELLPEGLVYDVLSRKPAHTEVIITGRCKHPPSYYALASVVSTVNARAHYATSGHELRKGIDF